MYCAIKRALRAKWHICNSAVGGQLARRRNNNVVSGMAAGENDASKPLLLLIAKPARHGDFLRENA